MTARPDSGSFRAGSVVVPHHHPTMTQGRGKFKAANASGQNRKNKRLGHRYRGGMNGYDMLIYQI